MRREILSTDTIYILHIYKQPTEYVSERTSQQAGQTCFLNSEMPKNVILAQVKTDKSTDRERLSRVPYHSPPLFPTIAKAFKPCQYALYPEPASRATRDAQKAALYLFPLPRHVQLQRLFELKFSTSLCLESP